MQAYRLPKLNRREQDVFLLQHIPHRICAVSTWLDLSGNWSMPPAPDLPRRNYHVWCICRSVDEGRYPAMRWLIEFVGVKMAGKGRRAVRPKPHEIPDQLVSIRRFDRGCYFPLHTRPSAFLAKIWKGCTQASVHPTRNTRHPDVSTPRLAAALTLLLDHLDRHLYRPNGFDLLQVLRRQELAAGLRRQLPRGWIRRFKAEVRLRTVTDRIQDLDALVPVDGTIKGRELAKAEIARHGTPVYGTDQAHPGMIVQKLPDGTKRLGRFVNRQFVEQAGDTGS